jgi:hypothetical protein
MYVFGDVEKDSTPNIETQRIVEEGRADIYWEAEKRRIIVEVKIGAEFTEKQPNKYVEELKKKTETALVLLAPARREKELKNETILKLGKTKPFSWVGKNTVFENVILSYLSLKDMAVWLEKTVKNELDDRVRTHMEEVIKVITDRDYRFKTKPGQHQVRNTGAYLQDMHQLINLVKLKLEEYDFDTEMCTDRERGFYYGFYIRLRTAKVKVWFGIWLIPWAEGLGPLWLSVEKTGDNKWFEANFKETVIVEDKGKLSSKSISVEGETWEELADKVIDYLHPILNAK